MFHPRPSLRVNVVCSKRESCSETEKGKYLVTETISGQEKGVLWQSWLKTWRIKISPLIYNRVHAWRCEVHSIKFLEVVRNCRFHIFINLVCHLIWSVLRIYLSSSNHCEQYLKCTEMCDAESSEKTEPMWRKWSAHFSAWSLSTKEFIWDSVIPPKEFAELELHSVCNMVKGIMIRVYGP